MRRLLPFLSLWLVFCGSVAVAQDKKFEFSPYLGYSASEGVQINPQDIGGGVRVTSIDPKSSFSWGLGFDYLASEKFSVGFNWNQQLSKLTGNIEGSDSREFTDMSVYNYHGIFTYNFSAAGAKLRPFLFGGLGATQYSPGDISGQSIAGETQFSTTWGGGVKFFPSQHVGLKLAARWTPTYIKSDPAGIYCSPYWGWGCWVVGDPDFSHQAEFSAGIVFRF